MICLFAILTWLAIEPASAVAQADRYELGRRLRAFEVEWDQVPDPVLRARASQSLKTAVSAFFAFRLADAGQAIGEARYALQGVKGPTDAQRWADSLCVRPDGRLIDSASKELPVTIARFIPTDVKPPEGARIRLALKDTPSKVEVRLEALPMSISLPLVAPLIGDGVLTAELIAGDSTFSLGSQTISGVENLDDRIIAVSRIIAAWPDDPRQATVERESVKGQLRLVESLAAKLTLESDFPASKILANLEAQAKAADQGESYLGQARPGQFWATLVTKSARKVPSRIFVPDLPEAAKQKGEVMPLVIALHGAGGSENMFFETYGHGSIVNLCRDRGWLLVAPRSTAFGGVPVAEVVDALAEIYPVDPSKVMLIGHSMGAGQAVAAGSADPSKYAAVAALGGGGSIQRSTPLKALPFFVGIGSEDFAHAAAVALVENLKKAEVASITYREYPAIEHLAIVQVALPDVFRFFDMMIDKPR